VTSGLLEFAKTIALEAGQILLDREGKVAVESKGTRRELVTEADRASEDHLVRRIRDRYPGHGIFAEEGARREGDEARWFIDPLDGTTNYAHQHPMYTVSLGIEVQGEMAVGVVWAPRLGEMFLAESGGGAYLNGERIRVSETDSLADSLLSTGFAYRRHETTENNIGNFSRILLKCRGVRRGGAASLDLGYVAAGRFDGFWEIWLAPYDVAAGVALVREAGGRITDQRGGDEFLFGENIIASNGALHDAIAALLDPFRGQR
jgi:myo-inositol-1(or 4)-monophosphatase